MKQFSLLNRIHLIFSILKGAISMSSFVVIFATLIAEGLWAFAEVPIELQPQVKEMLILMGLGHLTE